MNPEERNLRRLQEDLSDEADVESLLEVGRFLNQWSAPTVDQAKMAHMKEMVDAGARRFAYVGVPLHTRRDIWRLAAAVLRAQMRIVRGAIWLASALMMAIGALVTVMTYSTGMIALVIVAPIVAALGIAFIYGEDIDPPTELLMSTPVSPRLVLLARMALVFGFDLALGLAASAAAVLLTPDISFMPLVLAWFAPMAFLSALAFLTSVVFNDPLAGVLVSMGLWAALCIGHVSALSGVPSFVPDVLSDGNMRVLFGVLGVMMGALALWLAGREENLLRRGI